MNKLASILGVGVISMAFAFTPAFAQTATPNSAVPSDNATPKTELKTMPRAAMPAPEVKSDAAKVKSLGEAKTLKSEKALKNGAHAKAAAFGKHPVKKFKGKRILKKHASRKFHHLEKGKKIQKSAKAAPQSVK